MNRVERLTAPGTSALASVRLSGPEARAWIEQRFSKPTVVGRAVHGELRDASGVLDDPVCVLNPDGSIEVTLHGNPLIVEALVRSAVDSGFAASPAPAETLDDEIRDAWPRVRTELGARMLAAQREAWARIDSADRDAMLADRSLEHLLAPPRVAIVGVPNAGKSTLANQLFGQQRSIVSDAPGTTRDWVGELADLNGLVVELIDTPGRRETTDAIEQAAISLSDAPVRAADLVIVLLDPTQPPEPQRAIAGTLNRPLLVSNKLDLAAPIDDAIGVCARSGAGIDALIAAIQTRFGIGLRPVSAARVWTARQRASLER